MPGRIVPEDLEQLRQSANIVEVIQGYTQLKKAGRIFKGLCVFHPEKTPSMTVDPDKGVYHCFGCGVGGDVFTFVKDVEHLSFTEAAERLATRFGVNLRYEGGDRSQERGSRRVLLDIMRAATSFYSEHLLRSPEAATARSYLEGRGFTADDAKRWSLGFSPPGWEALFRHLLSEKFNAAQIEAAGLTVTNEQGQHRDRFRGRVMFPISDVTGAVIGFGARALGSEQPKYLNSPETPLYHKAKILYGLDQAKSEMAKSGGVAVVTEGYTDVIALHKVGVGNAVATSGTALGDDHLALIKRFCDRAILAFDADAAGAIASERAFGHHASLGLEVLVAPLPAGKDPADVALSEGESAVRQILEEAVPLMRFVLEAEIARHRIDTPEGKAKAVRGAAGLLSWEPNRIARGEHAFWVARRIGVNVAEVQTEIAEAAGHRGAEVRARPASREPGHIKVEREALALLMGSPSLLQESQLNAEHFTTVEHQVLFKVIRESGASAGLMDGLPDDATRRVAAELAVTEPITEDAAEVFRRLEEFRLRRKIDDLRNTLDQLDPSSSQYDSLFRELMSIEDQRREMESE